MPYTRIHWHWEEAFQKFGFGDGDGWNGTHLVGEALTDLGYSYEAETAGMYNYMIVSLSKDGQEVDLGDLYYEEDADRVRLGLPEEVVRFLDEWFHEGFVHEE